MRVIIGWKGIAAHLGVVTNTVMAYSRLSEDPLPVRIRRGQVRAYEDAIDDWRRRREGGDGLERYTNWSAICKALGGCDQKTAVDWASLPHDRLPIYGIGTRQVWIYASALRAWLGRNDLPYQAHARIIGGDTKPVLPTRRLFIERGSEKLVRTPKKRPLQKRATAQSPTRQK